LTVASLFVIKGANQGVRFDLEAGVVGIGRDATNLLQLHDSEISRRHAEVRRQGTNFVLADLGSSNGSFVNGRRVTTHELTSGDQIQLGSTIMLFTGPADQEQDLAEKIDIVTAEQPTDSHIVRRMTQEEGSEILTPASGSESPWLSRARSNLQIMYRTALAVSHTLDIDQLLARIIELIFEWVECGRGCILIVDPHTKELTPKVHRTRRHFRSDSGGRHDEKITISRTILDYVREHNEGVITSNAREDERWEPGGSILQTGVHEALCVPMQGRYDMVGAIYIDTTTPPDQVIVRGYRRKFTEEHLKLMIAIGHQAALAVEDTMYYSAMVQAERLAAVGQLTATLSHHIKNILQGISGGSYLIEEGLKSSEPDVIRKGWDIVQKNQQKISHLVMDMLTFSKEREPDLVPANLNEVALDVVELMQGRARELGVTLEFQPAEFMPKLKFDPDGLHRATLNVVTNALDACDSRQDGRVIVSTEFLPQQDLARIAVQDNGRGIDPEDAEKIFALFVSHKGGRGTGLGLPVSQKILREHGGDIYVVSEPGHGSRFVLELPAVAAALESDTKEEAPSAAE
jgi:signal transduction histidine kinase